MSLISEFLILFSLTILTGKNVTAKHAKIIDSISPAGMAHLPQKAVLGGNGRTLPSAHN
jgi:hypothetical protein